MSRTGSDRLCSLAAQFVLGALDAIEERGFEDHLKACASCAQEVIDHQEIAAFMAVISATEPPPGLRDRVLAGISPVVQPAALVRRNEGQWLKTPFPGVEARQLFTDPVTGNVTSMVRLQPGARYPSHFHAGLEHCYVLEGDLVFQDHVLFAGDYEVAAVHSIHSPVTSNAGCLLLLINNVGDQLRP